MKLNYLLLSCCLLSLPLQLMSQEVVETQLQADGPGETYELLSRVLGGTPYEVPDCDHPDGFQHIDEVYDETLGTNVFRFFIHKETDTDRCETNTDRQRNEIKTYSPSPDYLLGTYGEIFTYEWFFKIDEGFQPSSRFTHLFQIKASGGDDDDNPIFTLTPREGSPDQLELIHGPGGGEYNTLTSIPLEPLKGEWVKAYAKVQYVDDTAQFNIQLELLDGTELISLSQELDFWREGTDFVRPKWGIYRSLGDASSLRDEVVLFADFTITETQSSCPVWYEDADKDGLGDPAFPLLSCSQPEGYVANDDDLACRDYYEDADGDGLGDPSVSLYSCEEPEGYTNNNADPDCATYYQDLDADGLGNPDESVYSCEKPEGYVQNDEDEEDSKPTGLNEEEQEQPRVSPSPAATYVELQGLPASDFVIIDASGREMMRGKARRIEVSALKPGLYIIRLNEYTFRFIKE